MASRPSPAPHRLVEIRVRGRVQGVGFRPTVWRYAREAGLSGEVLNDAEGVLIRAGGNADALDAFARRVRGEPPPLAVISGMEIWPFAGELTGEFRIAETVRGEAHTEVTPDAAVCQACAAEVRDAAARHHQYAFTSCTHCGPRLTIVEGIPYDRARTSMAGFPLCDACLAEYRDPSNRRFHAEAIACARCGPQLTLLRLANGNTEPGDPIAAARTLLASGAILAIKGLGGYQLACDATNADAVTRLRRLKRRDAKPFALMARDADVIRRYCSITSAEVSELASPRAPIMVLRADGRERLPAGIAPGLDTLGFMLPTTPLHMLMLEDSDRPLVMTSGNLSDEPQLIDDAALRERLGGIASHALTHDRPIANRIDDSVVRVMAGRTRVMRRARGFAPAPIRLPEGFETSPELLAMGSELKAAFCLLKDGEAILSQHQGDLEDAATWDDYRKTVTLYRALFDHRPIALATDMHPEYLSAKLAREDGRPVIAIQHHHAHIAACLAENGYPLNGPPVLGVALDGLGWGEDGTMWGGELLLADYCNYRRLAKLKPVAMPGGAQAVREPWRNLQAHLAAAGIDVGPERFQGKPIDTLTAMIRRGINAPLASSCGRLFDAVAAALDLCFDRQAYEGEAAARLETLAWQAPDEPGYPFALAAGEPMIIDPAPMWRALLADVGNEVAAARIAARFHRGLCRALVGALSAHETRTVALSGGCLQNRLLFESLVHDLEAEGFTVLTHAQVPANDGGLALGQAAVAAARLIGGASCA